MTSPRRSDIVRAKRYQRRRSSKRQKTRRRSSNGRLGPPMVSRGERSYQPGKTRQKKKVRRRMDLSLKAIGAEVRLPAMPAVQVGWRLLSGIMVLALVWAIYTLWNSPEFIVKSVEVTGLERVSQEEFLSGLPIFGTPIFILDPQTLKVALLNQFSALHDLTIQVKYPADVTITVSERQPVIAWEQAGIAFWWVDIDGLAFEPLGPSDSLVYVQAFAAPPALPVHFQEVKGDGETQDSGKREVEQLLTPEMVQAILFLAEHTPDGATMLYDVQHGLGWQDPDKNWKVFFGSELDNMTSRLAIYQAILAELENKSRKAVLISVEFRHAPYYRLQP